MSGTSQSLCCTTEANTGRFFLVCDRSLKIGGNYLLLIKSKIIQYIKFSPQTGQLSNHYEDVQDSPF